MNIIMDMDIENLEKCQDLEGYLKSDDFFNVGVYFIVIFEIVQVELVLDKLDVIYIIIGNLMMKGIIKSVIIFVNISMEDGMIKVIMFQFVIDCIQWEVMYGVFVFGVVKDNIIKDEVAFVIDLIVKVW